MPADTISYIAGAIFGIVAIIGLCLNSTVLIAMYRGKLFSSKSSPVYILSAQTILVDTLLLLVHLGYQCPSVMLQSYLFPAPMVPTAMSVLNAVFMYCWYHNSLSHILVAVNSRTSNTCAIADESIMKLNRTLISLRLIADETKRVSSRG